MNKIHTFFFHKSQSEKKFEILFFTVVFITMALTFFEVDSSFWRYFYPENKFLNPDTQLMIKGLILLTSVLSLIKKTRFYALPVLTLVYGFWSGSMFHIHDDLFKAQWNPHGFIQTFLFVLLIAEVLIRKSRMNPDHVRSWSVSTVQLYIVTLYFQAAIAKLVNEFSSESLSEYIQLIGPKIAHSILEWQELLTILSVLILMTQILIPVVYFWRKRAALVLGIGFHLGAFVSLGLSFWFLVAFFPIVFLEDETCNVASGTFQKVPPTL